MKKCLAIWLTLFLLTACGNGNGPKPVVDSLPDNTVIIPGDSIPAVNEDTSSIDSSDE